MKKILTLLIAGMLGSANLFSQPCSITSSPASPGSNIYTFIMNGNWTPSQYIILWNFGDGTWGFGPATNHTYNINGTFLVNLTIRLFNDTTNVLCSSYDTVTISGLNPAPCAITVYPDSSGTGTIGFFANNVTPAIQFPGNSAMEEPEQDHHFSPIFKQDICDHEQRISGNYGIVQF